MAATYAWTGGSPIHPHHPRDPLNGFPHGGPELGDTAITRFPVDRFAWASATPHQGVIQSWQ